MLKEGYNIFKDEKHGICQIRIGKEVIYAEFSDETEKTIFNELIEKLTAEKPIGLDELTKKLFKQYPKEKVYNVLNEMHDYDLIDDPKLYSSFDDILRPQLSFWSQNSSAPNAIPALDTQMRLKETRLHLFGTNPVLRLLEEKARLSGFENIVTSEINSSVQSETLIAQIEQCDFFIFDTDEWNPYLLEIANEAAVKFNKPWILFNGIEDLKVSIGPLFLGRETGCYKCLINRLKSNLEFVPYFNEFEKYLKDQKKSAKRQGSPLVLYDMAASVCILEAMKYITEWTIPILYKNYVTINAMGLEVKTHPFLKAPVCEVCSPDMDFNPAPWLEPVTLK